MVMGGVEEDRKNSRRSDQSRGEGRGEWKRRKKRKRKVGRWVSVVRSGGWRPESLVSTPVETFT